MCVWGEKKGKNRAGKALEVTHFTHKCVDISVYLDRENGRLFSGWLDGVDTTPPMLCQQPLIFNGQICLTCIFFFGQEITVSPETSELPHKQK